MASECVTLDKLHTSSTQSFLSIVISPVLVLAVEGAGLPEEEAKA